MTLITLHVEGGFDLLIKHSQIAGVENGNDYRRVYLEYGRIIYVSDSYKDLVSLLKTGRTVSQVRVDKIEEFIYFLCRSGVIPTVSNFVKDTERCGSSIQIRILDDIRKLANESKCGIVDLLGELQGKVVGGKIFTCLGENDDGEKVWALK